MRRPKLARTELRSLIERRGEPTHHFYEKYSAIAATSHLRCQISSGKYRSGLEAVPTRGNFHPAFHLFGKQPGMVRYSHGWVHRTEG